MCSLNAGMYEGAREGMMVMIVGYQVQAQTYKKGSHSSCLRFKRNKMRLLYQATL